MVKYLDEWYQAVDGNLISTNMEKAVSPSTAIAAGRRLSSGHRRYQLSRYAVLPARPGKLRSTHAESGTDQRNSFWLRRARWASSLLWINVTLRHVWPDHHQWADGAPGCACAALRPGVGTTARALARAEPGQAPALRHIYRTYCGDRVRG